MDCSLDWSIGCKKQKKIGCTFNAVVQNSHVVYGGELDSAVGAQRVHSIGQTQESGVQHVLVLGEVVPLGSDLSQVGSRLGPDIDFWEEHDPLGSIRHHHAVEDGFAQQSRKFPVFVSEEQVENGLDCGNSPERAPGEEIHLWSPSEIRGLRQAHHQVVVCKRSVVADDNGGLGGHFVARDRNFHFVQADEKSGDLPEHQRSKALGGFGSPRRENAPERVEHGDDVVVG